MATPSAATARGRAGMSPASRPGTANRVTTTAAGAASTTQPGMSRSVRGTSPPAAGTSPPRSPLMTATSDWYMVGSARATATIPAAATAPAPM